VTVGWKDLIRDAENTQLISLIAPAPSTSSISTRLREQQEGGWLAWIAATMGFLSFFGRCFSPRFSSYPPTKITCPHPLVSGHPLYLPPLLPCRSLLPLSWRCPILRRPPAAERVARVPSCGAIRQHCASYSRSSGFSRGSGLARLFCVAPAGDPPVRLMVCASWGRVV
jgi:hypothetical protein